MTHSKPYQDLHFEMSFSVYNLRYGSRSRCPAVHKNYPFQIKDVFCRRTPHLRYEDPSINTWTYFFADEDIGRKEVPAVTFGNILINVTREQMIHRETQLIMSTISR